MRFLTAILVAVATAGTANAEMTISYHWNKECVDGKSPPITFSAVPEGTVKFDIVGDTANAGEFFRVSRGPITPGEKCPTGHSSTTFRARRLAADSTVGRPRHWTRREKRSLSLERRSCRFPLQGVATSAHPHPTEIVAFLSARCPPTNSPKAAVDELDENGEVDGTA